MLAAPRQDPRREDDEDAGNETDQQDLVKRQTVDIRL
jgi:hypothetical protein